MGAGHHVRDDFGIRWIRHRRLEHADDGGTSATETNHATDNGRIAVEPCRPESVGQHRDARGFGAIIRCVDEAAKSGAKAHHVEERAVDDAGVHHARFAESDHREVNGRELAKGADRRRARSEILNLRNRKRHVLGIDPRCALADVNQAGFIAIHQRPKQHAADDAEDRGIGADAERKRDDNGGRQTLGAKKGPQADAHVLAESGDGVEPAAVPDAPHRFAHVRDVAELSQRVQARGLRVLTALDPLLDLDRQVAANLVVEFPFFWPHGLFLTCRRRVHDPANRVHQLRPAVLLAEQLRLPGCGQPVVLRPLIGLADVPFRLQPCALFQPVQRWDRATRFRL